VSVAHFGTGVPRRSSTVVLPMCCCKARRGRRLQHPLGEDTVASEDRLRSMELIVCKIRGGSQQERINDKPTRAAWARALGAMSAMAVGAIREETTDPVWLLDLEWEQSGVRLGLQAPFGRPRPTPSIGHSWISSPRDRATPGPWIASSELPLEIFILAPLRSPTIWTVAFVLALPVTIAPLLKAKLLLRAQLSWALA
jgi:hypothetical protein